MKTKTVTVTFTIQDDGKVAAEFSPISGSVTCKEVMDALFSIARGVCMAEGLTFSQSLR